MNCPVCQQTYGGGCTVLSESGGDLVLGCSICGKFEVTREAKNDFLDRGAPHELAPLQRSRLTHRIKKSFDPRTGSRFRITTSAIAAFLADGAPGPTPNEQARNAIRYVGDLVSTTGDPIAQSPEDLYAIIGAANPRAMGGIVAELLDQGVMKGHDASSSDGFYFLDLDLTLRGWNAYEEERSGRTAGSFGFIALEFGNKVIDAFVTDVIKPACAELGYTLVDMRDVKKAGVIDNLMRVQIRDSAFVLADLSTDNPGAYWEAGFAEGLGKPVIYLCERSKHIRENTHFDTNHSTTVVWDPTDPTRSRDDLIATLRNSLDLFARLD